MTGIPENIQTKLRDLYRALCDLEKKRVGEVDRHDRADIAAKDASFRLGRNMHLPIRTVVVHPTDGSGQANSSVITQLENRCAGKEVLPFQAQRLIDEAFRACPEMKQHMATFLKRLRSGRVPASGNDSRNC